MKPKPLAALFLCCLPFFPAPLIAQDAGQTQANPAGAGSTGAVTPVDRSVAPAAETVAPATPDRASDASVNSASGETAIPPSTPGDNEKTAAVNLLNNRIGPNYLIG